jgi:DNA-binding NarL/FixJ family response regulator
MKIFLVANCPFLCERLTELLQEDGRHVVLGCAATVDAAVDGITASKPDVAMLDSKLRGGNGIDVLAEAKRRLPDLVGLVVSNHLTARDRKAAIDGAESYLRNTAGKIENLAAYS